MDGVENAICMEIHASKFKFYFNSGLIRVGHTSIPCTITFNKTKRSDPAECDEM